MWLAAVAFLSLLACGSVLLWRAALLIAG